MSSNQRKPLIGIVIPVYNESRAITSNLTHILRILSSSELADHHEFRTILVDDGSSDNTTQILARVLENDHRLRLISFVRNFGKESAILAGLRECLDAEAVIVMDSDLQHPPEMIGEMLKQWALGYKVVNAVKQDRAYLGKRTRMWGNSFYVLFKILSGYDLANHTDFKLIDKTVVHDYCMLPEGRRFFRGLIMWLGYPSTDLKFSVPARSGGGGGRWSQVRLFRYALASLTDFSATPLYLIIWFGAAVFLIGLVLAIISIIQKLHGTSVTGFTTIIVFMFLTTGPIMISLGLIGHYLGELFIELKHRPVYLIKDRLNGKTPQGNDDN